MVFVLCKERVSTSHFIIDNNYLGTSVADISKNHHILKEFWEKKKIIAVPLIIENNVSSTLVR